MNNRFLRLQPVTQAVVVTFLVVALFLSAYAFVYFRAQETLTSNALKQVDSHIRQSAEDIDSVAQKMISQFALLRNDPNVISLRTTASLSPEDYAKLLELKETLSAILPSTQSVSNPFKRLFLFFDTEQPFICCADGGIYHDLSLAVSSGSIGISGLDADAFLQVLRSHTSTEYIRHITPVYPAFINGTTEFSCFFIQPLGGKSRSKVYAVIQLSIDSLFDFLLNNAGLGACAGLRCHGETLYETLPLPAAVHEPFYDTALNTTFLSVPLDRLSMQLFVHVSDESILHQIRDFTILFYLLLFFFLLLLGATLFLIFRSLVYPMQHLSRQLQSHGHSSFSTFESEFQRINENLSLLRPALRTSLLDKLFFRDYLTPAERAALRTIPELPPDGAFRVILIGTLPEQESLAACSADIEALLHQYFSSMVIHPIENGVFAILRGCTDTQSDSVLHEELEQILCALQELVHDQPLVISVSQCAPSTDFIHAAFEEALSVLHEQLSWNRSCIRFHQKSTEYDLYNVSLDELDSLYRLLDSGSDEEAIQLYDTIVEREFGSELQLYREHTVCQQFFSDIRGILLRLSSQHDLSAIRLSFIDYPQQQQYSHILTLLRHALHYAASLVSGKQEASENDLAQSIQLYLLENYANPALSLSILAERFDMSESSMSRFFKTHMGVTFSAYVENLRLTEAETLLSTSALSVKDVSILVGYTTTTTFYKAFRRKWGISPTTHRKIVQKNSET